MILSLLVFFCFYGIVHHLILRKLFTKVVGKESKCKEVCTTSISKQLQKKGTSNKSNRNKNSHLFFYVLSVLQDKGRLLDFISEDVSTYEDAQIGVVARLIHENCKKAMDNYFLLEHILKEHEGETITLSDFDIKTVKFLGNVVGKPPYSGVIIHRGWRIKCKAKKLPNVMVKFDGLDTIYPAQVEIL